MDQEKDQFEIPEILPMLPVREIVIFPYMILPLFVSREKSVNAIEEALSRDRLIFLIAQRDMTDEDPTPEQIYNVGTIAVVMRMLKLADGRLKILVQGLSKGVISEYIQLKPTFLVKIQQIHEPEVAERTSEIEALMRGIKEQLEKLISFGKVLSPDLVLILDSIDEPGRLADLVCSNVGLNVVRAQEILEILDPVERLKKLSEALSKEIEVLAMQVKIQSQAKEGISKTQREYFLREQMRAIKDELGEGDERTEEIKEIRGKIKRAKMPEEVEREVNKQLKRLEQMHPDATEASMVRTYIEWLVETPWGISTADNLDIKKARQVLDDDHYDLEKVKERILEFLGVHKLKKQMKGPILCFVGPPGVGKTSLGKSIAGALGRKFIRISLGGIRDEAEIRGHRRTYVGALPGRIIQSMKQAGSNNPVFMLDEVDKIGADFRGDPSAALLEVLDPEQNNTFSDHYLNLPFDLSKVMFITTANLTDPIPSALKDRMEVIDLPGYTEEEKLRIARKYLLPRQLEENGIDGRVLDIADQTIRQIIAQYTREAGLRNLERELSSICRKVARRIAEGENGITKVTAANLHKFLGPPKYLAEAERDENEVGVSAGLAWTQAGGEMLYVEASAVKGRGSLVLTGHLGDVMKESAQAALTYARSKAKELGIDDNLFAEREIHIHVPAGAIPKDGPSAGVTMAISIISALTNITVKKNVAMTGEITLRGRILPVGGIKEKTLAAMRGKIRTLVIPHQNKKDLDEIPPYVRKKMNFVLAKHMDDILAIALDDRKLRRGRRNKAAKK
ncbi:MAG: endopeptidase La [Syntrophobacterales bacterium]|nr:MAG: endopeptidase La [Syntrophobacterales bacterium]